MKYRFAIFFSWVLTSFTVALAQQVSFIKYTVYDGLVANPVRCIYQDSKGFIWIGTFEGLSRYDGYRFINFTTTNGLSHDFINSFYEVGDKLLIAENNGAVDIIQNSRIQKGYLLSSAANFIMPYKNRVLISTDSSGFYEYKNDTIIQPVQEKTEKSLGYFFEYRDSLLIGDGIDNNFFIYKKDLTVYASYLGSHIYFYSIVQDSKKRIWACTSDGLKILQVPAQKNQPVLFNPPSPPFNIPLLEKSMVTSLIEEKDGSFWIGTLTGLIHLFPGGNYQIYNEKDGLPSAAVSTIYRDRENNLWIGTALGLAKWVSKNNVSFYNTEYKNFRNDILSLHLLSNNKILLNTAHSLQQFYLETKDFQDIKPAPKTFYIPVDGSLPLLVHYENKFGVFDNEKNTILPVEQIDSVLEGVFIAFLHPSGIKFLGTGKGLYAVNKSTVQRLLPHRITCLASDAEGDIWAGTWQSGLYRITVKNSPGIAQYDVQDITSLVGYNEIRCLYKDSKNNMWLGTRYNGAYSFTPKENGKFEKHLFNRQGGLMSDWAKCFAEAPNGDMWVGTYLGLDKLVKKTGGYRVFNFSKATNFFAQIQNIITPGDDIWICVANTGIAYFRDESIHEKPPLPVSVLSVSLGLGENKLTLTPPTEKVFLRPNQNAARFEFSALSYINEKQVLYSYRLKGSSDTAWSKPENIHEASYVSLSPGHYTFEVRTIGWNGEYSPPASFSFFISTPFWKQWWFISLCALLAAALFYSLYRYRIKQIMHLQQVRNTIATDLHDDIGSALTNISILAELSRNKNQQNAFSENLPGRISEESTLAQQALDDIIWSVNSNNDTLNQTMARMRRYAAETFEPVGINCNLDFESNPNDQKLNMEQRKDIYLVFKECLNNIIKHAAAKNVFIKIEVERNVFRLKIADDGKGFDTLKQTDRNGLKNIRSRIQRWTGKLSINTTANEGTTVDCVIPLASPK